MPKTKFESIIFSLMMVFCMVYCMTVYTISLETGGLSSGAFLGAIQDMWVEYVIVFTLISLFVTKTALKTAGRLVSPEKRGSFRMTLTIQTLTVLMMVPMITLCATFLHHGFSADWFSQWIRTAAVCYPAAYFLQVFLIGPFVRFLFRTIFRKESVSTAARQTGADREVMA